MELEIYDALAEYFVNLKIEVGYLDIRKYLISLKIDISETQFVYEYDAHLTFDSNIDIIKKEIERCILKYFKR